jgi:predicted metal-dependent phosphoesterase TrpH
MIRADLHVHSCFSTQSGTLRFLRSRDCYSTPLAVYQVAKRRGMDVVTLTDHDTIDGCLALLDAHPVHDFFISEEVSCRWPGADLEVHLGVYGMTEALHRQLQPLRGNVFAVVDALKASDVFFSLNHLFHFYREQLPLETYLRLLALVPAVEARNGTMLREHNELIARLARGWPHQGAAGARPPVALLGGSDAHTLRRVGQTWTRSPGRTATEFLQSLRGGLAEPGGQHGTAATVAGDTYGVVARFAASLLGYGPRDHRGWARAARLGFVAMSAPAQFLPMLIALKSKRRERLTVARATDTLTGQAPVPATVASPMADAR